MADIKAELAAAKDPAANSLHIFPSLHLRLKLAEFAMANGLSNEREALAVVAARYFQMVEDDRWASWLASREGS